MSSVKWYRVVDPLNPLCGCDVMVDEDDIDCSGMHVVRGLRRFDILMGDRPFQLINVEAGIGIAIEWHHLLPSHIQDDVVEIAYDYPNGKCIGETTLNGGDGDELRIVTYERAVQVAYGEADGELHATCTLRGDDRAERLSTLIGLFEDVQNFDHDALVAAMTRENH